MSERMIGDGKTDFKVYPPGVTPDPYIPPWQRKRKKTESE